MIKVSEVNENKEVNISKLYLDFVEEYKNVFMHNIADEVFIFRALGRKEYKEIITNDFTNDIQKEELICQQCLLYPDPYEYDWDNCDAGLPTKLQKAILKYSLLDNIQARKNLTNMYRKEMFDLDNQITCIINEAFPTIDIEEIEEWDIDKTTKYLTRAEWKLHNLRGIPFVDPNGDYGEYNNNLETEEIHLDENTEERSNIAHNGTNKKDKLTPEKIKEREEFLRKFPEFANDDIMASGIKGLEQSSVDSTPPALRPGW